MIKISMPVASVLAVWAIPAIAQTTVPTSGLTTTNGANDQASLCPPASGNYPPQFTWDLSQTQLPARDATLADKLTPRIEQHRTINGSDTIVAVWSSFSSNPNTCQEPFQQAPTQPAPGQPYTAAQMEPYTPAMLQTIASSGCGPFGNVSHVDLFRLWVPGDTFLVYPAVYTSTTTASGVVSNNNIVLHPQPDYYIGSGNPIYPPNNITIRGLTKNGIRPVIVRADDGAGDSESSKDVIEIQGGANDTLTNIGVTLGPNGYVLQAGVYLFHTGYNDYDQYGNALSTPILGASPNQTTVSHMHIYGFEQVQSRSGGANGVTGTPTVGGTVIFQGNEIDHNGGSGAQNSAGLAHGIYMDASIPGQGYPTYDPNFKVIFLNNWFHDQFNGHDAKSRAQYTTFTGNYFQGGLPQGGTYPLGDAFNADIPNGGVLVARNNILVKNASGYGSGQYNLAYGEEGIPTNDGPEGAQRSNSIDIQFNTYVAFSATEDGVHPMIPFEFFYPQQAPGGQGFPVSKVTVDSNAFVGFCPQNNAVQDYRGTTALIAGFGDLSEVFSFGGQWLSGSNKNLGTTSYVHEIMNGKRATAAVGAED